ncbi:FKBP-type peptidyl-prolyl cis-trans isomerase [Aspergillus saccharolyticus JOP 1030-1]|uniref:peptidylprolyl isomerase n=1 Tax=Aspergillus saccharolyticus JOP 1030-1 TaxID=1450539 RepID=A0A318ZS61_9EURO|nr:peptidyl-prolyl cis-trans isomerase [Aspergillus saccharolyticus JOP 1030-1]PYH47203.1 peptidyl-prolyl cis-trans isomerase [Aspergillus saccharolyticus JOP 1030-1]
MGVTKTILTPGTSDRKPNAGDNVVIHYTGCLYDESAEHKMGKKFDSSYNPGRGPFRVQIGVGQVIRGWDEGVVTMNVGEESVLTISPDYGYGDRGFPGLIPAGSTLVFKVKLIAIE